MIDVKYPIIDLVKMFSVATILGYIRAVFSFSATRYCLSIGNTLFRPPGRVTILFSPKEK
jgi:hypothetical protein